MKSSSLQLSSKPFSRHDARPAAVSGSFPQTGCDYHATTEAPVAVSSVDRPELLIHSAQIRSFRLLSKQALGFWSRWQFALETAVFSLVAGLAAWALVSLLIVPAQTAHG